MDNSLPIFLLLAVLAGVALGWFALALALGRSHEKRTNHTPQPKSH